jgi:hypothetical protein
VTGDDALTAEQMRHLLRECAVIVQPGETLVIRVENLSPVQVEVYQEGLRRWLDFNGHPFRVLVVPADELGVIAAGPA